MRNLHKVSLLLLIMILPFVSANSINVTHNLTNTDVGNFFGTNNIYSVAVFNSSRIYFSDTFPKIGYYTPSTNTTTNITYTVNTTSWGNYKQVASIIKFNTTDIFLRDGIKLGFLKVSSNNSTYFHVNSSSTHVTLNYDSTLIYNSSLIIMGELSGVSYYYPKNNTYTLLSAAITNVTRIIKINDSDILIGSINGHLGRIKVSSKTFTDLTSNDPLNWMGTSGIYDILKYNSSHFYISLSSSSKFGYYNLGTGVINDLTSRVNSTTPYIQRIIKNNNSLILMKSNIKGYNPSTNIMYSYSDDSLGNLIQKIETINSITYMASSGGRYYYLTPSLPSITTDCSTGTPTLNMTFYNEDNVASRIPADVELEVTTPINTTSYVFNTGQSSYRLCLNFIDSIQADIYLKFNSTNGFTNRYYEYDRTFNTTERQLSLYVFNTTTGVSDLKMTVRKPDTGDYYPNILTIMERRYISSNTWLPVQYGLTGEFGELSFKVREQTEDYRFVFKDTNNNILKSTNSMKFICTGAVCDTQIVVPLLSTTTTTNRVTATLRYNNVTHVLNTSWANSGGVSSNIRTLVQKGTYTGILHICDTNQTGSAGSNQCTLTGYTGIVNIAVYADNILIYNSNLDLRTTKLSTIIGVKEGALWTAVIVLVTVGAGLVSPVMVVVSGIAGLVISAGLGMFNWVGTGALIIAVIMGIVLALKMKQ